MEPLVMIVDDEPINVRVFPRMLTEHGIHCMTALSGAECLQKIDERKPDVILLDAMMPVMNGFELARHLKANPETNFIPLVMVTALTDLEARIRALDAGVDDFLSKPVDYAELLARVNASFKVKQYHDEIMRQKREKEELLNKTLKGTIRLLVEILALTNPAGFSQCSRLVPLTRKLAQYLMAEDAWQAEMAMMLSPIVEIMIPPALVDKMRRGELLEPDDKKCMDPEQNKGSSCWGTFRICRISPGHWRIGTKTLMAAACRQTVSAATRFRSQPGLPRRFLIMTDCRFNIQAPMSWQ